jgi:hypothetical protein
MSIGFKCFVAARSQCGAKIGYAGLLGCSCGNAVAVVTDFDYLKK